MRGMRCSNGRRRRGPRRRPRSLGEAARRLGPASRDPRAGGSTGSSMRPARSPGTGRRCGGKRKRAWKAHERSGPARRPRASSRSIRIATESRTDAEHRPCTPPRRAPPPRARTPGAPSALPEQSDEPRRPVIANLPGLRDRPALPARQVPNRGSIKEQQGAPTRQGGDAQASSGVTPLGGVAFEPGDLPVRRGRKDFDAFDEHTRLTCRPDLVFLEGIHKGVLQLPHHVLRAPGAGDEGDARGPRRVAEPPGAPRDTTGDTGRAGRR